MKLTSQSVQSSKGCFYIIPKPSMYGRVPYVYKNQSNVGKYAIHAWHGWYTIINITHIYIYIILYICVCHLFEVNWICPHGHLTLFIWWSGKPCWMQSGMPNCWLKEPPLQFYGVTLHSCLSIEWTKHINAIKTYFNIHHSFFKGNM